MVGPGAFIGLAEETGLIVPIGEWVLQRACAQSKAWQEAGLPSIRMSVNLSARQCAQQGIDAVVERALQVTGLAPQYLELELTESLSVASPEKTVALMRRLKEIGVGLALDDFGTGYSNMTYLKRFPIDKLKLDISFVREIAVDPDSLVICEGIIDMAHQLGLIVLAEGVETEGQYALLAAAAATRCTTGLLDRIGAGSQVGRGRTTEAGQTYHQLGGRRGCHFRRGGIARRVFRGRSSRRTSAHIRQGWRCARWSGIPE